MFFHMNNMLVSLLCPSARGETWHGHGSLFRFRKNANIGHIETKIIIRWSEALFEKTILRFTLLQITSRCFFKIASYSNPFLQIGHMNFSSLFLTGTVVAIFGWLTLSGAFFVFEISPFVKPLTGKIKRLESTGNLLSICGKFGSWNGLELFIGRLKFQETQCVNELESPATLHYN